MINKAERKVLIFEDSTEENKSEVIENIFRIDKNEKILCIGDVQSGKTSKMIQIIKASINKGYKATIIFGGSTKILIEQTTKRLKKEFQNNRNFYIYQIINEESSDEIHGDLRGKDTHLIFVLIKSKNVDENLKKLLNIFRNHFTLQKGIIFMDDECDSYSLLFKNETKLESEENLNEKTIASKINNFFNALKENPDVRTKYLSITATPFDNIQFNQENKYDRSVIFKTDKQYTGNEYFLEKKNFYLAINSSYKNPDSWGDIIKKAFDCWICDTFRLLSKPENIEKIKLLEKENKWNAKTEIEKLTHSEFVININVKKPTHEKCRDILFETIADAFSPLNITKYIEENNFISSEFQNFISNLKNNLCVYLVNSNPYRFAYTNNGFKEEKNIEYVSGECLFQILIGGNKISRGLTINNLITEIMLSAPDGESECDTLLQKSRWFGYRMLTANYMHVFTNENIKEKYKKAQECLDFIHKNGNDIEKLIAKKGDWKI